MKVKRYSIRRGIILLPCQFPNYSDSQEMADLETRLRARIAGRLRERGDQSALAAKLSTRTQGWLSRYLSGEFGMDIHTLEEIAAVWRVPVSELLGETPLPPLTPAQAEGQKIADHWPALPDILRRPIRELIELLPEFLPPPGDQAAATRLESDPPATSETPKGSRPTSETRHAR
jgi:transcriptional regulator with XRE-family HTH domain